MAAAGGWGKLLNDRPPNSLLLDAQVYIRERLEKKWLPLFLTTPEFAERSQPRTGMDDVVDDVLSQKRRRSQAVQKLLESRFVSSTKEIIIFRNALLNPVTSLQFRRFVSIKGDNYENDVLFWSEVQKFKEANHTHCDDQQMLTKINSIINCFIESPIPPSLQIDIQSDMAERIVDHKYERNPYLFRESQFCVFRILFPLWTEFCDFRINLAEEKVLPTIERQRRHARQKEKMKKKKEDEKALKEAEKRATLGLAPTDDLDAYHDPFASHGGEGGSEFGDDESEDKKKNKDKLSWTYSNYMSALQREDILNNTDEDTFSSLFSDTASQKGSEGDDREVNSVMQNSTQDGKAEQGSQTSNQPRKALKSIKSDDAAKAGGAKLQKGALKKNNPQKMMPVVEEETDSVVKVKTESKKVKIGIAVS